MLPRTSRLTGHYQSGDDGLTNGVCGFFWYFKFSCFNHALLPDEYRQYSFCWVRNRFYQQPIRISKKPHNLLWFITSLRSLAVFKQFEGFRKAGKPRQGASKPREALERDNWERFHTASPIVFAAPPLYALAFKLLEPRAKLQLTPSSLFGRTWQVFQFSKHRQFCT